ncbi:hypothetical protein sos41_04690 [Alphaproteobacteria bacterium SO-S41]|nr:hypothetical protein sos41_04690 [Alphaproteobacteria bacterium SO-S41]
MDRTRRKELLDAHKEKKTPIGVFAVRCRPTGEAWVSPSRNLAMQKNGLWFSLRLGSYPNPALQAAWKAHGEDAFDYEILETLGDEDLTPYLLNAALKDRASHWRAALNAKAVSG